MMLVNREILSCWLAALGCVAGCTGLVAGDAAPATAVVDDSIDFSGAGSDIGFPERNPRGLMGGAAGFLDRGNSLGGVLGGSTYAPPTASARGNELRQRPKWQDRLQLDESWPAVGASPSATDFERALGVREHTLQWSGTTAADLPAPLVQPSRPEMNPQRAGMGGLDLDGRMTSLVPELGTRRSLDPVFDGIQSPLNVDGLPSIPNPGTMLPQSGLSSATTSGTGNSIRSDLLDPLGLMRMEDLEVSQTVRGMMDQPQAVRARQENLLFLEQDATRQELNPYLPTMRDDFQFSVGDRRLGINGQAGSQYGPNRGPVQAPRAASGSSLAPAIALPVPGSGFTIQNRQAGQIQFPSRKF